MIQFPYDTGATPPSPCVEVVVRFPGSAQPGEAVRLLVDSGAEQTVIPAAVALHQQLVVASTVRIHGFGVGPLTLKECEAELVFPGLPPVIAPVLAAVAGLPSVLGRDVLNRYRVVLDGPNQRLEIH